MPWRGTSPLPVLAIILIALTCSAFARDETGEPAPRFRAKTTTGEQFNNASVKGQVVVFEFRTTWCKYREAEAFMMDDIARELKSKDLIVLAVDVLEPDQKVKKYLVDHPRSVPIVLTKDTNLAARYNAHVYPIYLVIDRDSNIAGEHPAPANNAAPENAASAKCCAAPGWNHKNSQTSDPSALPKAAQRRKNKADSYPLSLSKARKCRK